MKTVALATLRALRAAPWVRPRRFVAVAALTFLGGCQSDYRFHTVAVYEAPRGQYSIRVEGRGLVRSGHDISGQSSGSFVISPVEQSGGRAPEPIRIEVALRENRVQFGWDSPIDRTREDNARAVSERLSDAGYTVYPDELEEMMSTVEGVLFGPKGTPMAGQTKVLKVVSTDFDR